MAKAIHTMIRVFDLERSIAYYQEVFGLKPEEVLEFDGFTLAYLRNEESEFEVELTWNADQSEPYTHGSGYGHLAVTVDDLDSERSRLEAAGHEPGKIVEMAHDGRKLARFFFLQDPDGYKIEVLQRRGRYL